MTPLTEDFYLCSDCRHERDRSIDVPDDNGRCPWCQEGAP